MTSIPRSDASPRAIIGNRRSRNNPTTTQEIRHRLSKGALFAPASLLEPQVAAGLWYTLSSVVFIGTAFVLTAARSWRWFVAFALFPPTAFSLLVGQVNIVLLALLTLAWHTRERSPGLAGSALGVASAIKLSPARVADPAKDSRDWQATVAELVETASTCAEGFATGDIEGRRAILAHVYANLSVRDGLPRFSLRFPYTLLEDAPIVHASFPEVDANLPQPSECWQPSKKAARRSRLVAALSLWCAPVDSNDWPLPSEGSALSS